MQDLRYTDKHLQGKPKPGDNTTRQAAHIKDRTEEEEWQRKVDKGGDIQERRVISRNSRQEGTMHEDDGAGVIFFPTGPVLRYPEIPEHNTGTLSRKGTHSTTCPRAGLRTRARGGWARTRARGGTE